MRDGGTEWQFSPHATREWKNVNSGSPRDKTMEACCLVVRHRPSSSKCNVKVVDRDSAGGLSDESVLINCLGIA